MRDIILKAENISKQYRLGQVGTGTLSHDLNRWWHQIRGKEDPYLKIGETNDRSVKGTSDYVWALQDINFEVERGEVLGVIGKNGAGKSTLLKILSKVTAPTTGCIKSRGRIASLLEVGTGFNGEMTGRENIFLNGAILGMTKKEIASKLDEIIDFSGCERYIDTPVKRYSSGMTVRLAFAVAAFLEPEILVVDEVLAVGDAEFQKKAIGKMQDISKGEGRTVLFVSHNMASISKLCPKSILLEKGRLMFYDNTTDVINQYIKRNLYQKNCYNERIIKLGNVIIKNPSFNGIFDGELSVFQGEKLLFSFDVEKSSDGFDDLFFNIEFKTLDGIPVSCFGNEFQKFDLKIVKGKSKVEIQLGDCNWKEGEYSVNYYYKLRRGSSFECEYLEDVFMIRINKNLKYNINWNKFIDQHQHGHIPIIWQDIRTIVLE